MKLNELKPARGAGRARKRLGAGTGSGRGGTCGKGHKGQKCRSGGGVPPWFEGGQMPLQRRVPKRGFRNYTRKIFQVVNVGDLQRFEAGAVVGPVELVKAGLVRKVFIPVKLLGDGTLDHAVTVQVHAATKSAVEKVGKGGGQVEIIAKGK